VPKEFGAYFEPFLGSGSAFFAIADDHEAYLSDTISPLVNCFIEVRDNPALVAEIAQGWGTDSASYYDVRAGVFDGDPTRAAAQFIYLNKLCFNGLYRVNQLGRFNVPFGRPKNSNVADALQLEAASVRLSKDVTITVGDFEDTLKSSKEGDFVYLDPPYVAGHRSESFADYNAKIFSWDDQKRLADLFRQLDARGVFVVQSNADHAAVRALYPKFEHRSVSRYSSMSGSAASRGVSSELVVVGNTLRKYRSL
jgi:DNA adenine methylase